jgi:hypothetical protein
MEDTAGRRHDPRQTSRIKYRSGKPEMLRISSRTCTCGERLDLEGRLTGPFIAELDNAVRAAGERSPRVSLDLTELGFLDMDGARYLRGLRDRGVELHGGSLFVAELLGLKPSAETSPGERPRGGPCWT